MYGTCEIPDRRDAWLGFTEPAEVSWTFDAGVDAAYTQGGTPLGTPLAAVAR